MGCRPAFTFCLVSFSDQPGYLTLFGVPTCLELGVEQRAVEGDLEPPPVGRNQGDLACLVFEFLQE